MDRNQISAHVECCLRFGGAIWTYEGPARPDAPHALLASGRHSNGYVNVGEYLRNNPGRRREFASHLIELVPVDHRTFTCVTGADTSSTELAADVAMFEGAMHIKMIKGSDATGNQQLWASDNQITCHQDCILQVEDLITTAMSARKVREGIKLAPNCLTKNFFPQLLVIVDRSDPDRPVEMVENSRVFSLLRLEIRDFDPQDCPYCRVGSKAIKPKEGDNWRLLAAGS